MGRDFRKLDVYHKAYAFVVECYACSNSLVDASFTSQLRRALLSIPLNIVEGSASRSTKVLRNHLSYSYASAKEVEVLLCLAKDLALLSDSVVQSLLLQLDDVKKMLYGFLRSVDDEIDTGKTAFVYSPKVFSRSASAIHPRRSARGT